MENKEGLSVVRGPWSMRRSGNEQGGFFNELLADTRTAGVTN